MTQALAVPDALLAMMSAIRSKLSAGTESTVFRGKWRGQDVAVKKLRIATSADLDRFRSELAILASLSHPAVVPLLGARSLPPDYLLVLPLANGGTLRTALYERGWRPGWRAVLDVARQVASGLAHVHAAGVLHRDLKPANLLLLDAPDTGDVIAATTAAVAGPAVDPVPRVQIADFGLSVRVGAAGGSDPCGAHDAASLATNGKPSGGFYKRQMVGTLEYMAPELLLRTAPPSVASDVYALAVTINELATGTVPFSDCTKDNPEVHTVLEMGYGRLELAAAVAAEGLRPCLPRRCPPGFAGLMRACWELDPAARPSAEQVVAALEELVTRELPAWEAAQAQARQPSSQPGEPDDAVKMEECGGEELRTEAAAEPASNPLLQHPQALRQPWDQGARSSAGGAASESDCGSRASTLGGYRNGSDGGSAAVNGGAGEAPSSCPAAAAGDNSISAVRPPYVFHAGVFEAQGPRDTMEDRHLLLADLWGRQGPEVQQQPAAGGIGAPAPPQPQTAPHPQQAEGKWSLEDPEHHLRSRAAWEQAQEEERRRRRQQWQREQQQPLGSAAASAASLASSMSPVSPAARAPPAPPLEVLPPVPLAAVFDGHRGSEAADYCRARLPAELRAALRECPCPASALRRAFARLEEGYHAHWRDKRAAHLQLSRGPTAFPGATALAVLLDPTPSLLPAPAAQQPLPPPPPQQHSAPSPSGSSCSADAAATDAGELPSASSYPTPALAPSHGGCGAGDCAPGAAATPSLPAAAGGPVLYVANAGDCRAALVRRRTALPASRDHTGLLPDERSRLAAAGVEVTWQHGGWRVGTSGLQVTRCIGDFDVKPGGPAASTALPPSGVSAVPEVSRIELTPDDLVLILASDGLWDVVGLQEAAGLVYDTVKDPGLAAKRLACEALMRGAADNVTVLVVFLADVSTVERVFSAAHGGEAYGVTGTAYGSRTRLERDRAVAEAADELRDTY
ncbi:hypothetical protein GPECTOR_24g245 [Gonium pectorale]|uniref:Protein kinase domain-containing protein n=1 Tax=Gonium pectorale TaxID=33097 RepID=A0A150GH53_GONPE|nr:hypothetical protein GPECTOR_24g245 [Gonium pectorale]|eukprot:KXZ48955.1 hypothetical protein GPECTOR_24g245 [Gonium pectorale]